MKVSEYIPLYGLLFKYEYHTGIDGEPMTVNEMFDNYPDFELTDTHINQLYYFDLHSLNKTLQNNYFTPETVAPYLRGLFDEYRENGGNPFDWLQATFEDVNLNPNNYRKDLITTIEKALIEWIEIFEKQPIDYLYLNTNPEAIPPQQPETKTEQEVIELKPVFKHEVVQIIFDILKDYFSPEHQIEFRKMIETGSNASEKLLFKENGNRLTDTFKKLIEHNFITGCQKQDLINWIISNFNFTNQRKPRTFIYDTVEKTISRNFYPCKSPLIEIKNLQIHKVEQPRKRKQSKY